jgi:hypothetical protein
VEIGRLAELIERLAGDGAGVTVMSVREGTPMSGFGSPYVYKFDGWEVSYIMPGGDGELAVGKTLAEAVDAALASYDG